jgi:hypothetical protein
MLQAISSADTHIKAPGRLFAAIRGQHGGINCKKDRQAGSRSLPGTATGLSNDLLSMHSRFSEATTPHAMMRANSKRRAA